MSEERGARSQSSYPCWNGLAGRHVKRAHSIASHPTWCNLALLPLPEHAFLPCNPRLGTRSAPLCPTSLQPRQAHRSSPGAPAMLVAVSSFHPSAEHMFRRTLPTPL